MASDTRPSLAVGDKRVGRITGGEKNLLKKQGTALVPRSACSPRGSATTRPAANRPNPGPALGAIAVVMLATCVAPAAAAPAAGDWTAEFRANVWDPWFVFGMGAQGMFFLRFIVQWIVSEKRRRSTIPIAFWYLSLAGAVSTFVYAIHEAQPVFMLGQALACVIYIRNLMLIYGRGSRRRRAGLPEADAEGLGPVVGSGETADNGP